MCILWYCGSLEGLLAACRSLEWLLGALGELLGDFLEALEGLVEASWKPLGGLLRASGSWETAWKPFLRVLRVFTRILWVPGGFLSSFSQPGGALGSPWGPSGRRFGGSGGPLRGLLEATWRPLEGLWELGDRLEAIFTCFYVF